MLNCIKHCAVSVGLVLAGLAQAGPTGAIPDSRNIEQAEADRVAVPGTQYELDFGALRALPGAAVESPALLRAIVKWLSIEFQVPATDALPAIKFALPASIATLLHAGTLSDEPREATKLPAGRRDVVAAYCAQERTIYLARGWTGSTPVELSMLVHEMVHHLQHSGNLSYGCREEREEVAYAAQAKWLALFGRDMNVEFDLDRFTLAMLTTCLYY